MNGFSTIPFELVDKLDSRRVVRGRVTLPNLSTPAPYVLLVHGHRSFMDWAFLPSIASSLANCQIATVAFNMSGSGIGPDLASFSELEAFAKNTYSQEVEDLERVRHFVDSGEFAGLDPSRCAIFGHSRGGGMALLHAARRGDYGALCLWNPMHRVALFGEESLQSFEQRGFVDSPLASGQTLRLDRDILDDAHDNREALDIGAACAQISAPVLLVYGARDPLNRGGGRDALEMALAHNPPEVRVIERTGHTFGSRHPLTQRPPALEEALATSTDWLSRQLA